MAHRYGERQQSMLFPQTMEDYVSQDDPVRVYDAFVDALDWETLGIDCNPKKAGCPEYDPKSMLKVLLYGYSYGVRSSRKLERALYHNISFMWLAGGLKPDHKTIARFRRKNKKALTQVFKQCARLCIKLNVIAGNTLFVDGTKMRANACIDQTRTPEGCEETLQKIDKRIDKLLSECEQADQKENGQGSFVKLKEELGHQQQLKAKVQSTLDTLTSEGLKRMNTTDPDCARMHGRQGSHAGYNAQIVVDEEHGLIVNNDVVNDNNDLKQFAEQIEQAHDVLGSPCEVASADAGYSNPNELEKIDEQAIKVIVPTKKQASKKDLDDFDKDRFEYIAEEDCFICPAGNRLNKQGCDTKNRSYVYNAGRQVCMACCHWGACTKNKTLGRTVSRYMNQAFRDKLTAQYEEPDSLKIFARRKQTAELPFGHIKRNLGVDYFLLRGFEGVRAEMAILSSCFNIVRLIGLFGVSRLIEKLATE